MRKDEGFTPQLYFCCGCGKPLFVREVDLLAVQRAVNHGEKVACSIDCGLRERKALIVRAQRQ